MEKTRITKETIEDMFYLAGCALKNQQISTERLKRVDWNVMFKLSLFHGVESLIYYAIEPVRDELNIYEELMKAWENRKKYAVLKNAQLDIGRQELFADMEKAECWYMPLKGVVLKQLYPAAGMRQMSDNDILFDPNFRVWVRDWFINHGYSIELFDKSYDDVYTKNQTRCYEMHISLVGEDEKVWVAYYKNIKDRLIKKADSSYEFQFSDEDFYIYLLVHAYKHYSFAGTGVRILFDCFVFLNKKADGLNWDYINKEVAKLEIGDFEKKIREISLNIFDFQRAWDKRFREDLLNMIYYMVLSGTYGTLSNRINKGVERGKLRFLWERIFIPKEIIYVRNPVCKKIKCLLPFFYLKRIISGIFQKRIYCEVKKVFNSTANEKNDE